jgi:hypothetical protein
MWSAVSVTEQKLSKGLVNQQGTEPAIPVTFELIDLEVAKLLRLSIKQNVIMVNILIGKIRAYHKYDCTVSRLPTRYTGI